MARRTVWMLDVWNADGNLESEDNEFKSAEEAQKWIVEQFAPLTDIFWREDGPEQITGEDEDGWTYEITKMIVISND